MAGAQGPVFPASLGTLACLSQKASCVGEECQVAHTFLAREMAEIGEKSAERLLRGDAVKASFLAVGLKGEPGCPVVDSGQALKRGEVYGGGHGISSLWARLPPTHSARASSMSACRGFDSVAIGALFAKFGGFPHEIPRELAIRHLARKLDFLCDGLVTAVVLTPVKSEKSRRERRNQ